jgi:sialic acid synthase SpsE
METSVPAEAQRRSAQFGLSGPVQDSAVSIAGREINSILPPYIVAEISGNHGGETIKALDLIYEAKAAGADAVKLQTYIPSELTTPGHHELWALFEKAQTPREWHERLFEYARELDITIFSSAFSVDGVHFLAGLGAPAIKIASAEIKDEALITAAFETDLPVIVSTGMADCSITIPRAHVVLHCVSKYPTPIEEANLRAIKTLQYPHDLVGYSDHTASQDVIVAAVAMGAVMIESHLKLDDHCIDAAYSLNPTQFAAMCKAVRAVHAGMGDGVIRPTCKPRLR